MNSDWAVTEILLQPHQQVSLGTSEAPGLNHDQNRK